jgi:hypothetical protein
MLHDRLAQKRAIIEAREARSKLLKPNLDELHRTILNWDYSKIETSMLKV